jgi:multidrug efflux system outer membrane protein
MHRKTILLIAILPMLQACALGPKVPTPDARLPAAFEAAPSGEAVEGARLERWWTLYNDPQLVSLVDEALARAPDARSALARLREAMAVRSSALAAYDPQGAVQAAATLNDTQVLSGGSVSFPGAGSFSFSPSGVATSKTANFDVSWEIDLFGRRAATRKKANADLAAARFDYAASRASLAANVADSLFATRGLSVQLADARETLRIQTALADIARQKASHGLGSTGDADQAESLAAQDAAQVADLETQLRAARRTLLVLVGRGTDPLDSLPTEPVAEAAPPPPASVPAMLLARRPDVREAAAKLHSASGELKLDELALFPKFTLQPGVGLSAATGGFAPASSDVWSIGFGMVAPILDIPRLRAEIRAQGARADQAVIAYEKAVQTAYGEADNTLVQLGSDRARVDLLTGAEAKARAASDAARLGYSAGVDDLTTALSAESTWRSARAGLSAARIQALRRSVQAYKALGGGWSPTDPALARR